MLYFIYMAGHVTEPTDADRALYARQMYEFLEAPEEPPEAVGALVFGRHDILLAEKMGDLYNNNLAAWFVISGWFGKDSGNLWDTHVPENQFIYDVATKGYGVHREVMYLENGRPLIGKENARFGLEFMQDNELPHDEITAIAHAVSLRRLAATAEAQAAALKTGTRKVYRVPTGYAFDPTNPKDQKGSS